MNHGDHSGHDMPMKHMCKMNMLWNTDIIDTCIVFRSWHIHSNTQFFWSCVAIVALCVFHEYLRVFQRKLDVHIALALRAQSPRARSRSHSRRSSPDAGGEESGLLNSRALKASTGTCVPFVSRALRATVYGSTVFISFFLMLVFMTYNAYLVFSVVFGAALGHYIFGSTINVDAILNDSDEGKGMACH
ncbi:Ctr copper transporter family-domain-containing protein [Panaeolus papilionaceus]|nr:Ctr copper transporter family-domain-containing protein [Panaeolus papilionaceus]